MQLLRVASTMSYQGSPYSGPGDEYDFEDDGYDDLYEYRDPEDTLPQLPVDDSDEDTEEASETDIPNHDEPLEIKEQMYQDKLVNLKKQLQQLEDNIHPEFMRRAKRLQHQLRERLCINRIYKDHMYEVVEREFIAEKKAAAKEFDEKKIELKENLLHDFEEKRKLIESERNSMELNGDSIEVKPPMKRILRRRANEPAPAPEKRRKPLATTLTFQLDDRDIDADLRAIARTSPQGPAPQRKHLNSNSYSTRKQGGQGDDPSVPPGGEARARAGRGEEAGARAGRGEEAGARAGRGEEAGAPGAGSPPGREAGECDPRVEDGKLVYERRWYHRGQSVYVEGRDLPRFPAHIHAITDDAIWVKKPNLERVRIYVSQLARGKVTLKRRAS